MRLLHVTTLHFTEFYPPHIPKYAIASHRWRGGEEAMLADLLESKNTQSSGYLKVVAFATYVRTHIPEVEWLWIDTCCIDQKSSTELSEAINSMFRWYRDAEVCLAYLADVAGVSDDDDVDGVDFAESDWFRRGWTLQELLAPSSVVFLSRDWRVLGHKGKSGHGRSGVLLATGARLDRQIAEITNIPESVLQDYDTSDELSVDEKLQWMTNRQTTREEDMSYCLLGILDVHMNIRYGDGQEQTRARLLKKARESEQNPPPSTFSITPSLSIRAAAGEVHSVTFSPDGKRLATGAVDNIIRIWDATSGGLLQTLKGHTMRNVGKGRAEGVIAVTFSPDGKLLASGSYDRTVGIWNTTSGKMLAVLEGHGRTVHDVRFSPDGKRLASAHIGSMILWDVESRAVVRTFKRERQWFKLLPMRVLCVAFSPDGKMLASVGLELVVRIWNVESGELIRTLDGHLKLKMKNGIIKGFVFCVVFSPDGKEIASGADDETVRIWEVESGKTRKVLEGHMGPVWAVAFSPDGKRIVSGSEDTTVKVWDVESGEMRVSLDGNMGTVWSVAFSPDGRRIVASGSTDSTVKLWDVVG